MIEKNMDNKRKASESSEDKDAELPWIKKRKNIETRDNENHPLNDEEDDPSFNYNTGRDEIVDEEEAKFTSTKSFSVKTFRKDIVDNFNLNDVRHFIQEAKSNSKIIKKYIDAGGFVLELAQFFKKVDKNNNAHVSYIFEIINLVLIEILNENKNLTPAIEGCRHIVNVHQNLIMNLLLSVRVNFKKIILKFSTALVALDPILGKSILKFFNVLNTNELLEFVRHSKDYEDSVRISYINFILSYLIEGNTNLIYFILERPTLIQIIFNGLIRDNSDLVILFTETLVKHVLKNVDVNRTQKLKLFTLNEIEKLICLYDWIGPNLEYKNTSIQQNVAESVDELLIIFLTSRKFGCVFAALIDLKNKTNQLQKKVLSSLKEPWSNKYYKNLVIKILQECPELIDAYENHYENWFLQNENNSIEIIEFITELIDSLDPKILYYGVKTISITFVSNIILKLCLSSSLFMKLNDMLKNDNLYGQQKILKLLNLMLKQSNNYIKQIIEWDIFPSNAIKLIKFKNINQMIEYAPPVDRILESLYTFVLTGNKMTKDLLKHLETTIDFLVTIVTIIPSYIEKTSSVINYVQIMRPIYDLNEEEFKIEKDVVEMKAVHLILLLEPQALTSNDELFSEIVHSLLNIYIRGESAEKKIESRNMLLKMFHNTGLFENGLLEIDLWIDALKLVEKHDFHTVVKFFINIIKKMKLNPLEGQNLIKELQLKISKTEIVSKNIKELFFKIENDLTIEGVIDVPNLSSFYVVAFNDCNKMDTCVLNYIENVTFLMIHYLPSSEIIMRLIKTKKFTINEYIFNWLKKNVPTKVNSFEDWKLNDLSAAILDKKKSFIYIYKCDDDESIKYTINNEEFKLNKNLLKDSQIMVSIYLTTFYVKQFVNMKMFDNEISTTCSHFIIHFLDVLKQIENPNEDGNEKLKIAVKYIYSNQYSILQNITLWNQNQMENDETKNIINFIIEITTHINKYKLNWFDEITSNYRNNFINQFNSIIKIAIDKNIITNCNYLNEILKTFNFDADNCIEVLENLSKLKYSQFINETNEQTIFFNLLIYCLPRLSTIKTKFLSQSVISNISEIYIDLIQKTDYNFEEFEVVFYQYLYEFPHTIRHLKNDLFKTFYKCRKITKSTTKLASLLLERDSSLTEIFINFLPENYKMKELIFPLLNVIFTKEIKIEQNLLMKLYTEYKNGIMRLIDKPIKASVIFKDNIKTSLKLIEFCMPSNECLDFCNKSLKLDSTELFQMQLIKTIHLKAIKTNKKNLDGCKAAYISFINAWLQIFSLQFKNELLEFDKINSLILIIYNWIKLRKYFRNVTFEKIYTSTIWQTVCRSCIKFGMADKNDDKEDAKEMKNQRSNLLKIMAFMCDNFYVEKTNLKDPAVFFEMTISHSEFFDIIFAKTNSNLKTNLIYLLFVLVTKNSTVIESKHIPVYLGGYQAKLSNSDRYLLALINFYEKNGICLYEFRPFLWGESAISHYSLREKDEELPNLFENSPSILSLFHTNIIDATLKNFPIWRKLDTIEQLPEIDFDEIYSDLVDDNQSKAEYISLNIIQKTVESQDPHFNKSILKMCAQKKDTYDNVYDPAFYVPLLGLVMAPEYYANLILPAQKGCIGLIWASLSSIDVQMRLAAAHTLLRYKNQIEGGRKFIDKDIWIHLYNSAQNGLGELLRDTDKTIPRVPFVSGLYFSLTINVLSYPLHQLYKRLTNYLMIKKTFDFVGVPEFYILFQSCDYDHVMHRYYILEILKNGIQTAGDFYNVKTFHIFKLIMTFFNAPFSDKNTNLLILSIINNCIKIPKVTTTMITTEGLFPWLSQVIRNVKSFQTDTIEGIVSILSNIWYSVIINKTEYKNISEIELKLFQLSIQLLPNLRNFITLNTFSKYINLLMKITVEHYNILSENDINSLLNISSDICGKYLIDIKYIMENGGEYTERRLNYVRKLREENVDELTIFTISTLRQYVINWKNFKLLQN